VDAILAMRAHRLDKKIVALETVEEAGEAIDQIALKTQAELLMKVILNPEEEKELESTMLRLYTEQDLDGMEELYFESDVPGIVTEAIVYQRNRKFSEQLISLMKRKSVFCAVGALHLPGETGLIKSLRNAGFTVEPFYFEWKN